MLRFACCRLRQMRFFKIRSLAQLQRNFSDESKTIIGGGLGKPQGGLKEETYFYTQNYDLLSKIREEGSKLKCENSVDDWNEFEKVLTVSVEPTALRETCSVNKHKNCLEEAFFMNQQNDCCTKLKNDEEKLLKVSNFNKNDKQNKQQPENIENEPKPTIGNEI